MKNFCISKKAIKKSEKGWRESYKKKEMRKK